MDDPNDTPPVNPLPPVVFLLFAAVVMPEIAFLLGAQGVVGGPGAVGWRPSKTTGSPASFLTGC